MTYLIIGVIVVAVIFFATKMFAGNSANTDTPYSGSIEKIDKANYTRYLIARKTSIEYLTGMIREYGALQDTDDMMDFVFKIATAGDWFVIEVDPGVTFYVYHNLASWFYGYEEKSDIPDISIGFAQHKMDDEKTYYFYLDPSIKWGDTSIGRFNDGRAFFIYLPEAYEEYGNLSVSDDVEVPVPVTPFLKEKGFDLKSIPSLDFEQVTIPMSKE